MIDEKRIVDEWFKQAKYDMDTADAMFASGRFIYAIFMCHLSIEKALKGLFHQRFNSVPPKSHNLIYFVERLELKIDSETQTYIATLNNVSIPTRYPENLEKMIKEFKKDRTEEILKRGKVVLSWIENEYMK